MTTAEKTKAEFQLGLDADQLEAEATSAAGALEKLKASIDSDSKALAEMQKAMKQLQSGSVVNIESFRKLKAQMDLKRDTISKNTASYIDLGGEFKKTSSGAGALGQKLGELLKHGSGGQAKDMGEKFARLGQTMQALPGPLGGVVSKLMSMRGLLVGGAIALGIAAIVAALVALTVVTARAIVALYKYGVAQTDAVRAEKIRLEGLTKLHFWYQKIPGDAAAMQAGIDRVSASSSLSREEIVKLNDQLYRLGFRGENLALTMDAAQMKMAVQGDAAAQRFIGWATTANMAGESVKRLADRVKSDIGGQANRLLSSSEVQAKKLHESLSLLTSGLNIDAYLNAWREINELFSQSTETGQALKQLYEHLFQPMIDTMTKLLPIAKRFFQGLVIASLDLEIAILDVQLALKDTFGGKNESMFSDLATLENAVRLGKVAFWGLLIVLGLLMAPLVVLATAARIAFAVWEILFHDLPILVSDGLKVMGEAWAKFDFAELGVAIIDGIMKPLRAGWETIGGWFDKLGDSIISRFKKAIGSASPSKLFADAAVEIPRGVAVGIERGSPEAQAAVDNMVTPPAAASGSSPPIPSGAAAAGALSRGSSATVTIGELHVHADSSDPHELALDVRRELESILQTLAFQFGTEPEGAT